MKQEFIPLKIKWQEEPLRMDSISIASKKISSEMPFGINVNKIDIPLKNDKAVFPGFDVKIKKEDNVKDEQGLDLSADISSQQPIECLTWKICLPPFPLHVGGRIYPTSELMKGFGKSVEDASNASNALRLSKLLLLDAGEFWIYVGMQDSMETLGHGGCIGADVQFKDNCWNLTWHCKPKAPYPKSFEFPPLLLRAFSSKEAAIDYHKAWMKKTYNLIEKEKNPEIPEWLHETKLYLQLNLGNSNEPCVPHDFEDILNCMKDLVAMGCPKHTCIYIPAYGSTHFSDNFDNSGTHFNIGILQYPFDKPRFGGIEKFRELMKYAKENDFHIIPHESINLFSIYETKHNRVNPFTPQFMPFFKCEPSGQFSGPWPPRGMEKIYPYRTYYLSPYPEVQEIFLKAFDHFVNDLGIDFLYFDSLGFCGNDPYCDLAKGTRQLIARLKENHPHIAIAGEIADEKSINLAHIWHQGALGGVKNNLRDQNSGIKCDSSLLYGLYGDFCYFVPHTSAPSHIYQRGGEGIGLYGEELHKLNQSYYNKDNCIQHLKLNYRDYKIDPWAKKVIKSL